MIVSMSGFADWKMVCVDLHVSKYVYAQDGRIRATDGSYGMRLCLTGHNFSYTDISPPASAPTEDRNCHAPQNDPKC